jgi:hypothetical protein
MRHLTLKLLASPKVLSSKEIAENPVDFKMYDAIPASQQSSSTEDSYEMDNFLPMLNDYLKSEFELFLSPSIYLLTKGSIVHDMDMETETNPRVLKKPSGVMGQPFASDGDYVWDVFYHRPATLSEWNEAANVGTL